MYHKGQRFTRKNEAGDKIEIIIRRGTTATSVVFDVMALPYWWEGYTRYGLKMKQEEFETWLNNLQPA